MLAYNGTVELLLYGLIILFISHSVVFPGSRMEAPPSSCLLAGQGSVQSAAPRAAMSEPANRRDIWGGLAG